MLCHRATTPISNQPPHFCSVYDLLNGPFLSYRAICGLHPSYLKCPFTLSSATHGHHTRLASTESVILPQPKTNFEKKAISYRSAALWHSLPSNACDVSTISALVLSSNPICLLPMMHLHVQFTSLLPYYNFLLYSIH